MKYGKAAVSEKRKLPPALQIEKLWKCSCTVKKQEIENKR